jgi:hypothetical protein
MNSPVVFPLKRVPPHGPNIGQVSLYLVQGRNLPSAFQLGLTLRHKSGIIVTMSQPDGLGLDRKAELLFSVLPQEFMDFIPSRIRLTPEQRFVGQGHQVT